MTIASAIQHQQMLSFTYDGYARVVEPHCYGIDNKGHYALRAYQVRGGSESGEYVGWKLFHAQEIQQVSVLAEQFAAPRPGYKRGDKAFARIDAQL